MRWIVRSRLLPLLILAVLLGACQPKTQGVSFEPKAKETAGKLIDDLREMPQDAGKYGTKRDTLLVDPQTAKGLAAMYVDRFFAPWRGCNPAGARKSALRSLAAYTRNPGYDDSGSPRTRAWAEFIAANANMRRAGGMSRPAIAIANADLRAIPTMEHRFGPPDRPGGGYPFDMLQVSALWVGTPVMVEHISRDGNWALVETALAPGWVRADHLAYVDESFMAQYTSKPLAAIIVENVPLVSGPGLEVKAGVGAVLPVEETDGTRLKAAVPVSPASANGLAQTQSVWLTQDQAALMPMPATPANISRAANQMMGQPYGWGGLDNKRDCSAATRDTLAPFGIWLPRNSAAQAKSGMYIDLTGLSKEEKERAILKDGVPYLTLIWLPGHIMLYVGQYKGHPVVFHDMWGMRTLEADGSEGRKVVGKAVVTTLRLGEIYPEVGPDKIVLNRVRGMAVLTSMVRSGNDACEVPAEEQVQHGDQRRQRDAGDMPAEGQPSQE